MSFYSARNVNLTIGSGNSLGGVFANNATLRANSSISTSLDVDSSVSNKYITTAPLSTSLSLTYYCTGVDPLKQHMSYYDTPISVNFGGLHMNSGYLSSYSFNVQPYVPVEITAEVRFFEPIKGTFSPSQSSLDYHGVLNFSDFTFTETGIVNSSEVLDLNYSYSRNVTAVYQTQELGDDTITHNVNFSEPTVSVDIGTNDVSTNLPETGVLGSATVKLSNLSGSSHESYHVNGIVTSSDTKISPSEHLKRSLSMTQSNLGHKPKIISVTPDSNLNTGNSVVIQGKNLGRVDSVVLLDQSIDFTTMGSTGISFSIPSDAHTGPLTVYTDGGPIRYSGISIT